MLEPVFIQLYASIAPRGVLHWRKQARAYPNGLGIRHCLEGRTTLQCINKYIQVEDTGMATLIPTMSSCGTRATGCFPVLKPVSCAREGQVPLINCPQVARVFYVAGRRLRDGWGWGGWSGKFWHTSQA